MITNEQLTELCKFHAHREGVPFTSLRSLLRREYIRYHNQQVLANRLGISKFRLHKALLELDITERFTKGQPTFLSEKEKAIHKRYRGG
jgi:hypothetical protein